MDTTLLIMAAGIGSRFGGGIKQLEPVDDASHIIMDYSVHDAIAAGFNKIVFIIRKDIESDFREIIGDRIAAVCAELGVEIGYAYQDVSDLPAGYRVPAGRVKPWGTGQAVLAARRLIREPFAVLNADDYYGKEAFVRFHDYLTADIGENDYCMAGFILKNTLSENGGVTRGICSLNADGYLTDVVETHNIVPTADGAAADGVSLNPDCYASMNMWGLTPQFFTLLEDGFEAFLRTAVPAEPLKAEYLLPVLIGELLRDGKASVKVLPTRDKWFGVTYKEDKPLVVQSIRALIKNGAYTEKLYDDLF